MDDTIVELLQTDTAYAIELILGEWGKGKRTESFGAYLLKRLEDFDYTIVHERSIDGG